MFQGNPYYSAAIPGREIPKWFGHRSEGTSVNLQMPSDKLTRIAVCAVFVFRQHHPLHKHSLSWYLKANGDQLRRKMIGIGFGEQFGMTESYHRYLYYHCNSFVTPGMKENWIQDANGFFQIEIGCETIGPGLEVTKCGVHLILEQDIEDWIQTMRGCSSSSRCSITPYEDDLEDSAKDTKTK